MWRLRYVALCYVALCYVATSFDPFTIGSQVKNKQHLHSRNLATYSTEGVVRVV